VENCIKKAIKPSLLISMHRKKVSRIYISQHIQVLSAEKEKGGKDEKDRIDLFGHVEHEHCGGYADNGSSSKSRA
jgi:hypothetical protein